MNAQGGLPGGLSFGQVRIGDVHGDGVGFGVDRDDVPVLQQGDGPPFLGFGGDVTDDKTVATPEKRPSVISATDLPRPAPMTAEVIRNISGMPGPPLGPSYRMTITSPASMRFSSSPFRVASSDSNTLPARKPQALLAGDFRHRPVGGQVSLQNADVTCWFDRG